MWPRGNFKPLVFVYFQAAADTTLCGAEQRVERAYTEDGVRHIGQLFEKAVGAAELLSERTGSDGLRRRDSPAPIDSPCSSAN